MQAEPRAYDVVDALGGLVDARIDFRWSYVGVFPAFRLLRNGIQCGRGILKPGIEIRRRAPHPFHIPVQGKPAFACSSDAVGLPDASAGFLADVIVKRKSHIPRS